MPRRGYPACDYIGSTSGIMNYAKESDAKEFIIGTENSIVEHLQYDCPGKSFYPVSKHLVCMNMKLTTCRRFITAASAPRARRLK